MTDAQCRWVHDCWEAFTNGGLNESERSRVLEHISLCEDCRKEYELRAGLLDIVTHSKMDPLLKRRLEVAIEAKLTDASFKNNQHTLRYWQVALPLAAVAIAFIVILGWPRADKSSARQPSTGELTELHKEAPVQVKRDLPVNIISTAEDSRTIDIYSRTSLWVAKNTSVEIKEKSAELAHFYLKQGHVVAKIGNHRTGLRFIVSTPLVEVEAHGTIFSVQVSEDGGELARVVEGVVEVRLNSGRTRFKLRAGEELALDELLPRQAELADLRQDRCAVERDDCERTREVQESIDHKSAPLTAQKHLGEHAAKDSTKLIRSLIDEDDLDQANGLLFGLKARGLIESKRIDLGVRLARKYRMRGEFKRAGEIYEQLNRLFPKNPTAINGLVALAQMEQDEFGDPELALKHFNLYLEKLPDGALAEAAYAGRVRALFQQKNLSETVRAADEYLKRYKGSFSTIEIERKRKAAKEELNSLPISNTLN